MSSVSYTGNWLPHFGPIRSRTKEKLDEFRTLPYGWHYGTGGPINKELVEAATDLYFYLLLFGLTRTDAFAGADGEILLTAYHGNADPPEHYVGITIEPTENLASSLSFAVRHELNNEELHYAENIDLKETKRLLAKIAGEIWIGSDFYTPNIMTIRLRDLVTSHSSGVLGVVECPSWPDLAWNNVVAAFARTHIRTTEA